MGQKKDLHAFAYNSAESEPVFGWNLEHYEPNDGGSPWQIFSAICAV